ncbi:MAG: serine/threonine-protein kinase [Kofleriaceae bacterium]
MRRRLDDAGRDLGKVLAPGLAMVASVACSDLSPGSMVGSYRIEKEIGCGGMGKVFKANHTVLPRTAAIKIMHPELCRHPGMATRMVQEAAILEDVRHPGLVRVFECNILPDYRPFIAMEFVDGATLTQRLGQCGRMPWPEAVALLGDIADVLDAVHKRGIVHRDLKPDNLLLTPGDADFPLRLIDWGVARLGPVGRLTMEGMTPGTPIYMSPEQAAGQHIAAPCDIYSLGVIAYEALCGQPPFDGRTLAEVVCKHITTRPTPLAERCSAPAELCELVHRMLEKDPAARPMAVDIRHVMRAMVQRLDALASDDDIEITIEADAPAPAERHPAPEELELGVTELLPTMRKPRWTPQLAHAVVPARKPITPRNQRDQVSGEIVSRRLLK